jgi:hypothetical protein
MSFIPSSKKPARDREPWPPRSAWQAGWLRRGGRGRTDCKVDAAYAVRKTLGPGLLEEVYEVCFWHELSKRG